VSHLFEWARYRTDTTLRNEILAVAEWNRRFFEVPDLIGFRDLEFCATSLGEKLSVSLKDYRPGQLVYFPYPNGPTKLRWLSVLGMADLAVLRFAAGRILQRTDRLLSDRVFSYRLDPRPLPHGSWGFRKSKKAWEAFRRQAAKTIRRGTLPIMYQTDIQRYYEIIDPDLLNQKLTNAECDSSAVELATACFAYWRDRNALRGLPIGPEACAVLGNMFLESVDRIFIQNQISHLRYGDDVLVFAETPSLADSFIALFDDSLAPLRLNRSVEKTNRFDDQKAAMAEIVDNLVASLEDAVGRESDSASGALRLAYDREVDRNPRVAQSRFRWIVKTLTNVGDPYGCSSLAEQSDVMNTDPRASANYLSIGLSTDKVITAVMRCLTEKPTDRNQGLQLHLLRVASEISLGEVEAREFQNIGIDQKRLWPIRSWAWRAFAACQPKKIDTLMEAARAEPEPNVRRALIASMKSDQKPGRRMRRFLNLVERNFPESIYVADWLKAA
jgi:hypothetical protein